MISSAQQARNDRRRSSAVQSQRRRSSVQQLAKPHVPARPDQFQDPPIPKPEDIKMILSDVDGTLFDDDHEVHPRTRNALLYIRKHHPKIPIIPVTGKQLVSCETLREECELDQMPAGCCHGAIIYNPDGTVQTQQGIKPETVLDVVDMMVKHNKTCMLYEHDKVSCVSLEERPDKDFFEISKGFDPSIVDARGTDFLQKVKSGEVVINKIFMPMEETVIEDFMILLDHEPRFPVGSFKMTRALPYIIELVPPSVDKAVALAHFSGHYNIPAENIITFGDGENDVGMFSAAGYSVAMGNAMAKPRDTATYHTVTNNEGGVGLFLDKVFRPDYVPSAEETSAVEL